MRITITLWLLCAAFIINAQVNFNLAKTGELKYSQECNDVWGYVDDNGDEYAILGTQTGTAIIALDRADTLEEVFFIPGVNSTWRDIKHYQDHLYVTTDVGKDGLLIIDMSEIENDSIDFHFWRPELLLNGENLDTLNRCHNIYADDNGYAYLAGCRNYGGGVMIFDLIQNPDTPQLVGASDRIYAHDCYVRDNVLFTSDIFAGEFSMYDVSDKTSPQLLGRQSTTGNFTHNAWSSEGNDYIFTTDEIAGGFVDAYDISDPSDIQRLDTWRPDNAFQLGIIPHNTHVLDDYLVTSWYIEGVIVLDASQPDNLVKVAQYDTYLDQGTRFNGAWGAYPFLPSGRLLVSDINSGLFVFEPNYVRAGRIEGVVTDIITGESLTDVRVTIMDTIRTTVNTDARGNYQSGTAFFGDLVVQYEKTNYQIHTDTLSFVEGQTIVNDVSLSPKFEFYEWDLTMLDSSTGTPMDDVRLILTDTAGNRNSYTTLPNGSLQQPLIPEGTYTVYAGKWGFKEIEVIDFTISNNRSDTMYLARGYRDFFNLDLGWSTEATASAGFWVRDIPNATEFDGRLSNPGMDSGNDFGDFAYVTGNSSSPSAGFDDVDNGTVSLLTPWMDLSNYDKIELSFDYWFFSDGGNTEPNDTLVVSLVSPSGITELIKFGNSRSEWRPFAIDLDSMIQGDKDSLRIEFITADQPDNGHLVEAGIDVFRVDGEIISNARQPEVLSFNVYPNPSTDYLQITDPELMGANVMMLSIRDAAGKLVRSMKGSFNKIHVGDLPSGMYFLQIRKEDKIYQSRFLVEKP